MHVPLLMSVQAVGASSAPTAVEDLTVRLFVRHNVADYATWRRAYDGFAEVQRKGGVVAQAVYRSEDSPGDVTVVHDFRSAVAAKAYTASPELKIAMEKAAVVGVPRIWFTTSVDAPLAEATGVRLFVRHTVADPKAWRKAYDGFAEVQRKGGVVAKAVFQSVDDPSDVTVVHDFKDLETAKAFTASPDLKATMEKAGVVGAPQLWFTARATG
jgi:quinol monooxygenase YgiN